MQEETQQKVAELLFQQRENGFERASFDREIAFYESIGAGNMEMMRFFASPLYCEGYGTLSKDKLRNLKYHFVVLAALVARFCIRYGMTPELAYQLSDVYIMQVDECQTESEIHAVHKEMLEAYTRKMQRVRNSKIYSKQIVKAIEYISEHLHSKIMLHDVAEYLKISDAYLSRLFKEEIGMLFSDYVNQEKINAAANLLRYSNYSDLEISNLFCFSSQSYFIKIFKKHFGMTPKAYKKQYQLPELI
ncbi:MAG: AraC family transcriptional regulator [Oscillospiraceae bacterium]|nr:AraC family transcriptional regulator [Oscillospiraceae bacterium]